MRPTLASAAVARGRPSESSPRCANVVVMTGNRIWTARCASAPVPKNIRYINATVTRQGSKSLANGRRISTARLLLSILCVFLVLLGSTLEAAHSHPGHDSSHADCALCATAHVIAQVSASLTLPAV